MVHLISFLRGIHQQSCHDMRLLSKSPFASALLSCLCEVARQAVLLVPLTTIIAFGFSEILIHEAREKNEQRLQ
jgi:hypothetical protein